MGRGILLGAYTDTNSSEVAFLHPALKLARVSDTLGTSVPVPCEGHMSWHGHTESVSLSGPEGASMYVFVCGSVSCSEYKDAF